MDIMPLVDQRIVEKTVEYLRAGALIIFPTETCYGLGVDATNPEAVSKLLAFKAKREGKPISVVMADQEMAEQYVELNTTGRNLYKNFLPGPVTVISKVRTEGNEPIIDPRVVSEMGTLGVRIPDHRFAIEIVKKLGRPMTATSANVSYNPNPYSLEQWEKQTPEKSRQLVDLFIDAGSLPPRPSSTVVDTTTDELTVVRQGSITLTGEVETYVTHSEEETKNLAGDIVGRHAHLIRDKGLIIGLQGELGAGKTRFAKGVAQVLGITEEVRSPTFTLVEEYLIPAENLKMKNSTLDKGIVDKQDDKRDLFFHIDVWRMERAEELLDIEFEKMVRPGNLVVIEWIEKVAELVERVAKEKEALLLWGIVEENAAGERMWKFGNRM